MTYLDAAYQILREHGAPLRYEEITRIVRVAAIVGLKQVRLTGGEPLVRRGIVDLVRQIAATPGIEDVSMTTNGTLLGAFASDLHASGLRRVNISLDTLDPLRYAAITRGGSVHEVLAGIAAAQRAGLNPIKINCVVGPDGPGQDADAVAAYAQREGLEIRFIQQMNLACGCFSVVQGGSGGDCARCNRLRLTSDGQIRPCLFSDLSFSVRQLGVAEALARAVAEKPSSGSTCNNRSMHSIGG